VKKLFLFFCLLTFGNISSQVVFCPPGAAWSGLFSTILWSQATKNSTIAYLKDSISGTDTLKMLFHNKFYGQCNYQQIPFTLIKQKGDTIFMLNQFTQNAWEILYNFGCTPTTGWKTTYILPGGTPRTYSITVDSLRNIAENGFTLRQLVSTIKYAYGSSTVTYTANITERYGWGFLFTYRSNSGSCDGDFFLSTLCYSDNYFGTKYFGENPCDFQNPTGFEKRLITKGSILIFPNPISDMLNIKSEYDPEETELVIQNVLGNEVRNLTADWKESLDVSDLQPGIYFVTLAKEGRIIHKSKMVKQ
jgi:hypothetical protein